MSYKIASYTKQKAQKLGVVIKPSTNSNKKIDVFKNNKKIASVGATGYADFAIHKKEKGIEYAKERQRLYKLRHKNNNGINGYYAVNLLW
jgi:hypothetical protein